MCIPPPRAGRMSARVSGANGHEAYLAEAMVVAFQGCAQTVNTHGTHTHTHTHTHTGEHACNAMVSI